jgi:hypothetical protein
MNEEGLLQTCPGQVAVRVANKIVAGQALPSQAGCGSRVRLLSMEPFNRLSRTIYTFSNVNLNLNSTSYARHHASKFLDQQRHTVHC